ncbi:MAG TPA: glycosyltransferase family 4 protein [Candidatus Limnocylindria bacterium]|nr:glycosyltransferase family 4 protein [Candidatus Limnocylindria bacterium]
MRIAQVAPLTESVPPQTYGGTERVVSYLTEELVRQGHDVTLFASGDSVTTAELVACAPRALRLDESVVDPIAHEVVELECVAAEASRFDIIHWHLDYFHFPMSRRLGVPQLTTLHGRLDIPDLAPVYREFGDMPVVSISNDQRAPLPNARWVATIHHGMPLDELELRAEPGEYLAFLGRISPEKRLDRAIEIARRAGLSLRVAAKVDDADRAYYEETIEPLLGAAHVEFIGEVGGADKQAFLAGARALLFPIDWSEPFGLVMIESMACGTPVIAFRNGSVPEVIDDGVTGFIVDDVDGAVEAVGRIDQLSRATCRSTFEARFSVERMARDYVALYEHLVLEGGQDAIGPIRGTVAVEAG